MMWCTYMWMSHDSEWVEVKTKLKQPQEDVSEEWSCGRLLRRRETQLYILICGYIISVLPPLLSADEYS